MSGRARGLRRVLLIEKPGVTDEELLAEGLQPVEKEFVVPKSILEKFGWQR
jgi:hypothetical protein